MRFSKKLAASENIAKYFASVIIILFSIRFFANIFSIFCRQATLDEMRQMSARICRDYLTGKWKSINADDIVFRRIR